MAKSTRPARKTATRKTAKAAPKKTAKPSVPETAAKPKDTSLRGQVDITIAKALEFVGGDADTVISVSRKSLVLAQTRNAKAESAAALSALDDSDL